jgi:protein-tyrosine phosphatase
MIIDERFLMEQQIAVANWRNGRSAGYVNQLYNPMNPQASWFDVPMISHVEGNLYQGGVESGYELDDDFVGVVSLYPRQRYVLGPNTERTEIFMLDAHEGVDWDDLDRASDKVLEYMEKGKTLVHCQAGLNRSGLVAAVALMKMGRSAQEAIDLLRRSRDKMVLCNTTFVNQLHELQHRMEENEHLAMEGKL